VAVWHGNVLAVSSAARAANGSHAARLGENDGSNFTGRVDPAE